MLKSSTMLRVARVTLEATSPLSIASGARDGLFDLTLVKDAMGLPAIPGTSLAGVLRQAFRLRCRNEDGVVAIFGEGGKESRISRLFVSWGRIHDRSNKPVDGLPFERAFAGTGPADGDPILGPLLVLEPPHREHVRLSHKGAPSHQGKFDRVFVPAGHRFTFTLSLHDDAKGSCHDAWQTLLACLASPSFRLGGATRRGYGGCKVQRLLCGAFDLSSEPGLQAYSQTSARLDNDRGLDEQPLPVANAHALQLELAAEDYWRIGGIQGPERTGRAKIADELIYQEQRVLWRNSSGELSPAMLVAPASSIKGALCHRLAFHYNRLAGVFADQLPAAEFSAHVEQGNPAVRVVFGHVTGETARAGALVVEDGEVSGHDDVRNTAYLMHTSIDRFTGGVRNHVLFSEEALYGGKLHFRLFLDRTRLEKNLRAEKIPDQSDRIREALKAALTDLAEGRLPLGAGMAKGHGYFKALLAANTVEKLWEGNPA